MKSANITPFGTIAFFLLALLARPPLIHAQRSQQGGQGGQSEPPSRSEPAPRSEPARVPAERGPAVVERAEHGSIRHSDAQIIERPAPAHPAAEVRQPAVVHHEVNAEISRSRFWNGFVFGRRHPTLRPGYRRIVVNNIAYYYDDGIYYQQADDGYQEVYPPLGADVGQLPDGAIEIEAGSLIYYYAAGAFYVRQAGGFVIAPAPMGVTVPDLPPGAVQVSVNNGVAYQFNGIYYQPVFVNGETQYMTFMP